MDEQHKRHTTSDPQDEPQQDPVARSWGNGEGEEEGTPPGGDVRTIYSEDRAPGEAEPDEQPS